MDVTRAKGRSAKSRNTTTIFCKGTSHLRFTPCSGPGTAIVHVRVPVQCLTDAGFTKNLEKDARIRSACRLQRALSIGLEADWMCMRFLPHHYEPREPPRRVRIYKELRHCASVDDSEWPLGFLLDGLYTSNFP